MTTTINKTDVNPQIVFELLKNASWDYNHCGDRIKSGDMDEYINELSDNISLKLVTDVVTDKIEDIISEFDGEGDVNKWAAVYIADSVAWQISDCVCPTVTFIANL